MQEKQKNIRIEWVLLAIFLLLCVVGGLYLYRPRIAVGGTVAMISVDGEEFMRISLTEAADGTFSIKDKTGKPVSFEIKTHAIRFVEVICPDHVCEKAGWCDAPGERAVCLPNRTALVCYDAAEIPA